MLWLIGLALAADTDRVFFIVLDGIRDEEGVEAEGANMPLIWGTLRPQGALVPLMWNRDSTVTDSSHRVMVTGRRQPTPGLPWYPGRVLQRSWSPTLFEAASVARGGGGYVVGNAIFMDSQGRSLVPGYAGSAITEASSKDNASFADDEMADLLRAELTADMRVALLNLHAADKRAHGGRWDGYLGALTFADRVSAGLVDTYGTERTTWFFLSDHGRHRDDDWPGHGDQCDGCRSSWLLALGAGIAEGATLDFDADLVDVATTGSYLLGAPLPAARGRVLSGLLVNPPPARAESDALVEPRTALDATGTLHQVARRLPEGSDNGALLYRSRSADGAWTSWAQFQSSALRPEAPWIVAEGSELWRAWRAWQPEKGFFGVYGDRSTDGGATWGSAVLISGAVQPTERPTLAAGGGFSAAWWSDARGHGDTAASLAVLSASGDAWATEAGSLGDSVHVVTEPYTLRSTAGPLTIFAAIAADHYNPNADETPEDNSGNQDRDIWLFRGSTATPSLVRLTELPTVEYWPALAQQADGTLIAAWATRSGLELDGGAWSVVTSTSVDDGTTWSAPLTVASALEAWKPVLHASAKGTWLATLEMGGGTTSLVVHELAAGGVPGRRATVLESAGWVEDVELISLDDGLFVSWSESVDTLTHRVGDTLLGPDAFASEDTGTPDSGAPDSDSADSDSADSDTPGPNPKDDPCGSCGSAAALPLLAVGLGHAARRRRSRSGERREG